MITLSPENVPTVASATSCTCNPSPGTSRGRSVGGNPGAVAKVLGRKPCGRGPPGCLLGWGPNASCLLCCSWPRWCLRKPPSTAAGSSTGTLTTCAVEAACSALGHPRAQCNPHNEELCSLCGGGARAPIPARTQPRCRERPAPAKETCLLKPETTSILSSQEPSSPAISIPSPTSEHTVQWQALLIFTLPLVLVLLMTSAAILLFALQRRSPYHPYPGLLCSDSNTSQGPLETSKTELPNLASQPLSRLLDELEVLEELIVLLDPEPGPGGPLSCGTTRHLAARYGLPAAWSTFAYSLRPSHSPLRALIEMVVAREPSASLGQLGTHLAQLGRADALQVLSKLA
ncbi:PREDICTED: IGF-like family receptor 1 isoform X3 [Miniopterus natalensis]|uniref:IGF-like family receptor 1 isoform X3 n=1 Tax=Miniopterus natalensis TaxID=291302 RepID=UPI0007A6D311|nr:PREDICTED: IGF-like family receptor 1 isoform X3 [Miniopterus natalensis]